MDRFTLAMCNAKHQRGTELVATEVALSERLVLQRHRGMDVSRTVLKTCEMFFRLLKKQTPLQPLLRGGLIEPDL